MATAMEHARDSLRFFKNAGFHEDRARGELDALERVEKALARLSPNINSGLPRRDSDVGSDRGLGVLNEPQKT